jgi:hypothetical protein
MISFFFLIGLPERMGLGRWVMNSSGMPRSSLWDLVTIRAFLFIGYIAPFLAARSFYRMLSLLAAGWFENYGGQRRLS